MSWTREQTYAKALRWEGVWNVRESENRPIQLGAQRVNTR